MSANPHRLSRNVRPIHYRLVLEPDLATATFFGSQDITLAVDEPVRQLVLNAVDLAIDQAWLITPGGQRVELSIEVDPGTERVTFGAERTLEVGNHQLHTRFCGELNDKLRGFYRSTFKDHKGDQRTIATTQFESTNARRAFPCLFDGTSARIQRAAVLMNVGNDHQRITLIGIEHTIAVVCIDIKNCDL